MPMSRNRCSAAVASVACSDDSTRWPVSADCTAMRAVSTSRISPTRMTSGSWRRIALRPPDERDVGLLVDLDLVDRREHVLDRVFDRHDVAFGVCRSRSAPRRAWWSCRCRSGRRRSPCRTGTGSAGRSRPASRADMPSRSSSKQRTAACRARAARPSRPRSWPWWRRVRRARGRRRRSRTGRPANGAARRCSSPR